MEVLGNKNNKEWENNHFDIDIPSSSLPYLPDFNEFQSIDEIRTYFKMNTNYEETETIIKDREINHFVSPMFIIEIVNIDSNEIQYDEIKHDY
jgi:hypothetical protein